VQDYVVWKLVLMDTLRFLQDHGYSTIFVGLLLEYLGLPIPGELILLFFGTLVYWGKLELWVAASVGMAAMLLGNHFWFFAGRRGGKRWLHVLCRATFGSTQCISRTEHFFQKYGPASLVFAKFVPGFRTFAVPLAGMTGIAYPRFLLFETVGNLFWLIGTLSLGMLMATQLNRFLIHIQHLGSAITVLVVLTALIVFFLRLRKRLKYGDPMKEFESQRGH
jgi:membrane protein DedA with SNARE-associated domain